MAYLDFANFWFVSSITKGNNSIFISTYEVEKYDVKLVFLCIFFQTSFPGRHCE